MKSHLVQYLACPTCCGDVTLKTRKKIRNEIHEGSLTCLKYKEKFPIKNGIPRFVVDKTKNFVKTEAAF